jgi:hypothetical protein|eukprot:SAG25_NODE_431_length_8120_cov_2.274529_4_plen_54_part_00
MGPLQLLRARMRTGELRHDDSQLSAAALLQVRLCTPARTVAFPGVCGRSYRRG